METASSSSYESVNLLELPLDRRQIYYKLRSIFPSISSQYVRDILINTPEEVPENAGIEQMTNGLVEHLILHGDQHVDLNTIGRSQNYWELQASSSPDSQYDRLIGIFPDADPDYLRDVANRFYNNAQKMNSFIEDNLEEKTYPTREEYVKRKKSQEKYRKYFTDFDIKNFIAEFPDPFTYFEGEERNCNEDKAIYDLLCNRFQSLPVGVISNEYRKCKFNPSLTFKNLKEKNGVKNAFSSEQLKKLDMHIPEFAFIFNRATIKQHLEKMKKEDEEALQKSTEKNELLHCENCFNDFIPEKCSTCTKGHIFCNDCISFGTECKIAEATYTVRCFKTCNSIFNLKTLEKVLKPKIYNILVKKQQEEELAAANIGNLENCPFCDFKSLINEEDKIFTCMNEDCKKESCRQCKKANHLPLECADVFEPKKARLYLEEKMTKALVRTCYNCKREFVKEIGCNRMNCLCGAVMCYICDKAVPADNYKHFNGQGSDRFDLCPLYSDDHRQEAEAVIKVALDTQREIQKRNPELNMDIVDSLLPVLPPKTSGPHDQIPNANQIPEHAIRVAKAIPP